MICLATRYRMAFGILVLILLLTASCFVYLKRPSTMRNGDSRLDVPDDFQSARVKPIKSLDSNRELKDVVMTPEQMRQVGLRQKVILEGEACGVGSKGSSSLQFHFGIAETSTRSRKCFYGGIWPTLVAGQDGTESDLAYWVRIECCRVDCGSVDFAEFCIDEIRILGVSITKAGKINEILPKQTALE